jgi:hypothetical protein
LNDKGSTNEIAERAGAPSAHLQPAKSAAARPLAAILERWSKLRSLEKIEASLYKGLSAKNFW